VQRLKLPRHYSDQLYNLRSHIELVAQKLAPRPMPVREVTQTGQAA